MRLNRVGGLEAFPGTKHIIQESDGTIPVGTIVLIENEGIHGDALLGGLMVESEVRRTGVGRRLVRRAEIKAKALGFNRVFAVTHPSNVNAISLMLKLGYTE